MFPRKPQGFEEKSPGLGSFGSLIPWPRLHFGRGPGQSGGSCFGVANSNSIEKVHREKKPFFLYEKDLDSAFRSWRRNCQKSLPGQTFFGLDRA